MKTLWKNALVLAMVCALAALSLGIVNQLTAERITLRALEEWQEACQMAFCEAEEFETLEISQEVITRVNEEYNVNILETLAAKSGGRQLGYVFRASTFGYGGPVVVMVGVSSRDQRITGVVILEHQETPGLGSNIASPDFLDQFAEKPVDDPFRLGQDIEAIAGATISSRAVLEACLGVVRLFEEVES